MNDPFTLSVRLNSPVIPAANQPRLLYLLLEAMPNPRFKAGRAPVNLVLVVDASDSMLIPSVEEEVVLELARRGLLEESVVDGIPTLRIRGKVPRELAARAHPVRSVDFVQAALRVLVDRLRPADRLSLIAFAGRAETLVSSRSGSEKRKILDVLDVLASGKFGDDTYMASGLEAARREADRGASPEHITRLVLLTDGFAADAAACHPIAEKVAHSGYTLSTMGLGLQFNEGLLISLAETSGGHAHLIFEAQDIPDAFAAEFEATGSVLLRSLDLKLALTPGVELRRAHKIRPFIAALPLDTLQGRSFTAALGDLERGQPVAVLMELVVPPRATGTYRLAQVALAGERPGQQTERFLQRADVLVQVTSSRRPSPAPDPEIMNLAERVSAFKLQTRALNDAAAGDVEAATRKLEAAATRLLALGEEELAKTVREEARSLAQQGRLSSAGTKKLRYETRKLTQKLNG